MSTDFIEKFLAMSPSNPVYQRDSKKFRDLLAKSELSGAISRNKRIETLQLLSPFDLNRHIMQALEWFKKKQTSGWSVLDMDLILITSLTLTRQHGKEVVNWLESTSYRYSNQLIDTHLKKSFIRYVKSKAENAELGWADYAEFRKSLLYSISPLKLASQEVLNSFSKVFSDGERLFYEILYDEDTSGKLEPSTAFGVSTELKSNQKAANVHATLALQLIQRPELSVGELIKESERLLEEVFTGSLLEHYKENLRIYVMSLKNRPYTTAEFINSFVYCKKTGDMGRLYTYSDSTWDKIYDELKYFTDLVTDDFFIIETIELMLNLKIDYVKKKDLEPVAIKYFEILKLLNLYGIIDKPSYLEHKEKGEALFL